MAAASNPQLTAKLMKAMNGKCFFSSFGATILIGFLYLPGDMSAMSDPEVARLISKLQNKFGK